jgi:argininosuccinate synthase
MPAAPAHQPSIRRIVLACSGGLDTTVALKWLQETYGAEVVCLIVDVGQPEDLDAIAERASNAGASEVRIEDARAEFAQDFAWPMLKADALYEGRYLLGSALARPLIAKKQVDVAREIGADAVSHGATGKGNDQIRFELTYAALAPDLAVTVPWREWDLSSRSDLLNYASEHGLTLGDSAANEKPLSVDQNLLHTSYEGEMLEDPGYIPPDGTFGRTRDLADTPDFQQTVTITFRDGAPVALDEADLAPQLLLEQLNRMGSAHGIGRVDMIESRILGMKSRNVYETPGLTILRAAHLEAEAITLDREVIRLKEDFLSRYTRCIYDGLWFSPEREVLQAAIDRSQCGVDAAITLRIYKGNVDVVARSSDTGLYDRAAASFDDSAAVSHADATAYIRLSGLRLRLLNKSRDRHTGPGDNSRGPDT